MKSHFSLHRRTTGDTVQFSLVLKVTKLIIKCMPLLKIKRTKDKVAKN